MFLPSLATGSHLEEALESQIGRPSPGGLLLVETSIVHADTSQGLIAYVCIGGHAASLSPDTSCHP